MFKTRGVVHCFSLNTHSPNLLPSFVERNVKGDSVWSHMFIAILPLCTSGQILVLTKTLVCDLGRGIGELHRDLWEPTTLTCKCAGQSHRPTLPLKPFGDVGVTLRLVLVQGMQGTTVVADTYTEFRRLLASTSSIMHLQRSSHNLSHNTYRRALITWTSLVAKPNNPYVKNWVSLLSKY